MIGELLTPCAVAVSCAVPTVPGTQTCGLVSESQVPAHAVPFPAIVTTVGLLDKKENVSLMTVFCAPLAVAMNGSVFPTSSDTFKPTADELVSETLVGTGFVMILVVVVWPQEARNEQTRRMQANAAKETNRPMNPSN